MARASAETLLLEHSVPGRARLRVPRPRSPEQVRATVGRIEAAQHVSNVQANANTGSLLVTFKADDPLDLIIDELRMGGLEIVSAFRTERSPVRTQTRTAAVVRGVASRANTQLHLVTRGHFDLRLAVPAIYMVLGVRNLIRHRGRLRDASWYQLMYWAFDSFYKLHEEATVEGGPPGRGSVGG